MTRESLEPPVAYLDGQNGYSRLEDEDEESIDEIEDDPRSRGNAVSRAVGRVIRFPGMFVDKVLNRSDHHANTWPSEPSSQAQSLAGALLSSYPPSCAAVPLSVPPGHDVLQFRLERLNGVFGLKLDGYNCVTVVSEGGAADVSGLRVGDLVAACDGIPLAGELSQAMEGRDFAELVVVRPRDEQSGDAAVDEREADSASDGPRHPRKGWALAGRLAGGRG